MQQFDSKVACIAPLSLPFLLAGGSKLPSAAISTGGLLTTACSQKTYTAMRDAAVPGICRLCSPGEPDDAPCHRCGGQHEVRSHQWLPPEDVQTPVVDEQQQLSACSLLQG